MPPFPVDRDLFAVQFSGSQSSYVKLDLLDVGIDMAMRQILVSTVWFGRPHEATLSGNWIFVPLVMNSR